MIARHDYTKRYIKAVRSPDMAFKRENIKRHRFHIFCVFYFLFIYFNKMRFFIKLFERRRPLFFLGLLFKHKKTAGFYPAVEILNIDS